MPMRKIVMLGANARTQRSVSSIQLPAEYSPSASSAPYFNYSPDDFILDLRSHQSDEIYENGNSNHEKDEKKALKELLHERWENAKQYNAFNYPLNCMYRCLDGKYDLSMQLNIERGELRRKPMHFKNIKEPFNHLRFNFAKLHDHEILFYLKCDTDPISNDLLDRHLVAVNASPLERDHSLIVPSVNKCSPQVLTLQAVRIAVDLMLLVDDDMFHILFNSLLGQASVNHLHLHAMYWPYDSDLINRKCEPLHDVPNVYVIRPPVWICPAIVFQLDSLDNYEQFKMNIYKCVEHLTESNQAHNLFLARAQPIRTTGAEKEEDRRGERPQLVTCYVFPRMNMIGAKPPSNFNPAANELAGNLTSYTIRFFESANEQSVIRIIEEEASLDDDTFRSLCFDLADVLIGRSVGTSRPQDLDTLAGLTSPEIDELRDSFQSFMPRSPSIRHRSSTRAQSDEGSK
ncbi:GDP-D-glucose phosphorylase 1 [Caenorhabditis elegans]|nr:GDP-D-glucose phosphorylase 1 [Caenorhabditis elegans]CCD64123.1 GDP-D-glucose phosphorylase 1 [Caenorhabditis elegans]|eukprot:NP_001023638.1 GDP-D-glucose phosphorylase 1 [Caenorhabditis elegans]